MRKRWAVFGLVVMMGLGWSLWPRFTPSSEPEPLAVDSRLRTVFGGDVTPEQPADLEIGDRLRAVLSVCRQCREGTRTGEICAACDREPEVVDEEPATVELVVDVVNEDGRPEDRAQVGVWGCPVLGRSGNVFTVAPGLECVVRAFRREGMLRVPSEEHRVAVDAQGAYVQLELPRAKIGGLGVQFRPHPEGKLVERVNPGTPAAALGLQHGDVITAVDGVPADQLGSQEFVRTLTGPVGSEVEFTVRYTNDDGTVREERKTLRRAFLEG